MSSATTAMKGRTMMRHPRGSPTGKRLRYCQNRFTKHCHLEGGDLLSKTQTSIPC